MNIIDCFWELENIGKRTVLLDFANNDIIAASEIHEAVTGYEYLVAKVPCGNISCLLGLQHMGFKVIETQMTVSKRFKDFDFNDKYIRFFNKRLGYNRIEDEKGLKKVLESMTLDMFSTDRIYYDPEFGPKVGLHRYQNWIRSEFEKDSVLFELSIGNNDIGFGLVKCNNNNVHYLLGGIYEKYQNMGYGILTAANPFLYCRANKSEFKKVITAISSNNVQVMQCYNYLNFKIDHMSYVLVKHQ